MAPFHASAVFAPIGGWLSDKLGARFGKRIGRGPVGFTSLVLTGTFITAGATTTSACRRSAFSDSAPDRCLSVRLRIG